MEYECREPAAPIYLLKTEVCPMKGRRRSSHVSKDETAQTMAGSPAVGDAPAETPTPAKDESGKKESKSAKPQAKSMPKAKPKAKASANKPAPTGGQPSTRQKRKLMEEGRTHVKKPTDKQTALGLNFWESIPYTVTKIPLRTPYAQYAARRALRNLPVNAYLAEVYPSTQGWKQWPEILRCIETIIDQSAEKVESVFTETEQQLQHLFDTLGLTDEDRPQYINVQETTVAITTPRVRQYLRYLERLDRLVVMLDALWMAEGGISNTFMRHEAMRLRSTLLKLSGKIFSQSDRIRRVMAGRTPVAEILTELQDELSKHYGVELSEKDGEGNEMLIPGEKELEGPLTGTIEVVNEQD